MTKQGDHRQIGGVLSGKWTAGRVARLSGARAIPAGAARIPLSENVAQNQRVRVAKMKRSEKKNDLSRLHIVKRDVEFPDPQMFAFGTAKQVTEMQAMKRLWIVLLLMVSAAGCQGGLFRRPTSCASSGMVYEGMPCEDGGAYLNQPQFLPGPQ